MAEQVKSLFYSNDTKPRFLDRIKENLRTCDSFAFSVSFIKERGLRLILPELRAALERGVKGAILTSTYQNFTDVNTLNILYDLTRTFPSFSCRCEDHTVIIRSKNITRGFHTKGFLFTFADHQEILIGSSNFTVFALNYNFEWDLAIVTDLNHPTAESVQHEFSELWGQMPILSQELIANYAKRLSYAVFNWDMDYLDDTSCAMKPNAMQSEALQQLQLYRARGANRALVIAATGSGKTLLAAFDVRNFGAMRMLYIVHRGTILKEAQAAFGKVFGSSRSYGMFTGEEQKINADFIFATNFTMARNVNLFNPESFNYIVFDEVHHAVGETYQTIMNYFHPDFMLGLTATPDRCDEQSIYELFQYNVPYQLRLREAILNDLIVPFHYYGISDTLIDYDDHQETTQLLATLAANENIDLIDREIQAHLPQGKLKAIAFCVDTHAASLMAQHLKDKGYDTVYLTGSQGTLERLQAFERLQNEDDSLQIICAVDILNEGVDLPAINMVLFLRPTDSSTIFIQQLGRGLRKSSGKEFLTVLDFIGNHYRRSVQIAIGLGTLTANTIVDKRLLADLVRSSFTTIGLPGLEIHLEPKAREEILSSIENTNFNKVLFEKQDYFNFKKTLGKANDDYVRQIDYLYTEQKQALLRYLKKHQSYIGFLRAIQEPAVPACTKEDEAFQAYLSHLLPLNRPEEYEIIESLLTGPQTLDELKKACHSETGVADHDIMGALAFLTNKLYSLHEQEDQQNHPRYVVEKDGQYVLAVHLSEDGCAQIHDTLEFGLSAYEEDFAQVTTPLKLYFTYTRESLKRVLNDKTLASREGLLWIHQQLYIFIDLKKDQAKESWLLYNDKFLAPQCLQWESATGTTFTNSIGKRLITCPKVSVFVRKIRIVDGLVQPYFYLGEGNLTNPRVSNNQKKSLLFDVKLANPVPDYLQVDFEIEEAK